MRPPYAAFTEAEHRARLAQVRRLLKTQGIDHCVSVAPESLYYYGGYDSWVSANSPQALIFSADGDEPTIVLRDTDLSLALESAWVREVRPYRLKVDDAPGIFAAVARKKGLRGGKVAVETQSYAIAHAQLVDEGIGVIQGGTYALTDCGVEMLVGGGVVPLEVT